MNSKWSHRSSHDLSLRGLSLRGGRSLPAEAIPRCTCADSKSGDCFGAKNAPRNDRRRHDKRVIFAIALAALIAAPIQMAAAQFGEGGFQTNGVNVSGHFDVQAVGRNAELGNNNFQIGQLAVDLTSDLSSRVMAAMEIAYDFDEQVAIDEAFVDWNVYRVNGEPKNNPMGTLSVGFMVGQFDVPFGLDWRSYRSVDRPLASIPTVIANTHRGWNDLGVEMHGELTWANWSAFAVNGFGTSPTLRLPDRPVRVDLTAGAQSDNVVPTEAYGARFGLVMSPNIEFGTSFAAGYTDDNMQDERLFGFDFTGQTELFELKAEFINHQRNRVGAKESVFGYYMQEKFNIGDRWFGVMRQDAFNADGTVVYPQNVAMTSTLLSTSAGCGYRVGPSAQVRAEYQLTEGSNNDTVYLQTAVGF